MMRTSRRTGFTYWAPDPAPRRRRRTEAEMLAEQRTEIEALDMDVPWIRRCIAELESMPKLDADNRRYLVILRELQEKKFQEPAPPLCTSTSRQPGR